MAMCQRNRIIVPRTNDKNDPHRFGLRDNRNSLAILVDPRLEVTTGGSDGIILNSEEGYESARGLRRPSGKGVFFVCMSTGLATCVLIDLICFYCSNYNKLKSAFDLSSGRLLLMQ